MASGNVLAHWQHPRTKQSHHRHTQEGARMRDDISIRHCAGPCTENGLLMVPNDRQPAERIQCLRSEQNANSVTSVYPPEILHLSDR